MSIHERSAGIVLYQSHPDGRRYLLLDYGKHWDFPKGHVEQGESDQQAARRELAEETGIGDVQLDETFAREMDYWFRARGQLIHKTVIFFIGVTASETVQLSKEHTGYAWLPYTEAMERLTYASAREMLTFAERHLVQMSAT